MPSEQIALAPAVAFVTLGCAKNEVDTDRMKALLLRAGMRISAQVEDADVVVVNTCSFLTAAVEEGVEVIFDVLSNEGFVANKAKLVVAGCMPSRYGEELSVELGEASAFLPCADEDDIAQVVRRLTGYELAEDVPQAASANGSAIYGALDAPRAAICGVACGEPVLRTSAGPCAYVKISDGCDRFCSFCAIPYIRGRYASRPASDIEAEVSGLRDSGVREIALIAQDTGVWGSDLGAGETLATLVSRLAEEFGDMWFRLLYIQPDGISSDLLQAVASHENIAPYFDIPVQHANAGVLKRMNRSGNPNELLALVSQIRQSVPGAALRTTVMAGFPGESEEDFEELCDFLQEARFDYTGVFKFSCEDGTAAARLDGQVPDAEADMRAGVLHDIADAIGFKAAASHVGDTLDVLIEGYDPEERELLGRSMLQAPEVDGQVHIALEGEAGSQGATELGKIVRARITDAWCYELVGEVVS